jgi:hypothetical protein
MTNVDVNEQVRRREFVRDMRAASSQGQELEEYRARRNAAVDEWTAWFRSAMNEHHVDDPAEVLPMAFALLQERVVAEARAAAKAAAQATLKAMLRKAIGHG